VNERPIDLAVTPTVVKHYFQYRCERQARYLMLRPSARAALAIAVQPQPTSPWAEEGAGYEQDVVSALAEQESVLRLDAPGNGLDDALGRLLAFLRRELDARYAYQAPLDLSADQELRVRWGLPPGLGIGVAFADLIRADPGAVPTFRVIDVKLAQEATSFHRAQVAMYALLLERLLERHCIPGCVDDSGEIWHARPSAEWVEWSVSAFRLSGYRAQVLDLLRGTAARLAAVPVTAERDETAFHLYFKCEQCRFLPHCRQAIADDRSPADWDVSAVPGLSRQSKVSLGVLGVRTVGQLAAMVGLADAPGLNWSLRQNAELLLARATALLERRVARLPRRYTCAMPGEFDLGIFLAVDRDPVEGRLAALGCLCEWGEGPDARREWTVRPIAQAGDEPERVALLRVLGAVVSALDAADRHNAAGEVPPIRAHLFVYEPSEAADLRDALGRHLGDAAVRTGLLHMLRVFPPDDVPPEPEYRGVQHLPATALRTVIDDVYALPVRVAHALGPVTQALAAADPPLTTPYVPDPRFERPFSSRLNIDACLDLKAGRLSVAEVADDLTRRLRAASALARWLVRDNRAQRGGAEPHFLRLVKRPFRWQATFHPLAAGDLDLLRAQELLDRRCRELEALVELARRWEQRRDRFRCFARLRLLEVGPAATPWSAMRLRFAVPGDSARAEIAPGDVGLILTDDDPDVRLNPAAWPDLFVDLVRIVERRGGLELIVDVKDDGPLIRCLLDRTPADGWFLDKAYLDLNGDKMDDFLTYLGQGRGGARA
jgi:hypothetical protein